MLSLKQDERFTQGIALDAWLFPLRDVTLTVKQPLLFISTGEKTNRFSKMILTQLFRIRQVPL